MNLLGTLLLAIPTLPAPAGYDWIALTSRTNRDYVTEVVSVQTASGAATVDNCLNPQTLTLNGIRYTFGGTTKTHDMLTANICHTARTQDWYKCDDLTGENLTLCRSTITN